MKKNLLCLVLAVGIGASSVAYAQETSSSSLEFWPELDLWWRFSPKSRLSLFAPIAKSVDTDYREGNLILQVDYGFGRIRGRIARRMVDEDRAREMTRFLVRGGYLGGRSLDDQGQAYSESSALVEVHVRTPLKGKVLVSHRLRTDLRWLGDDQDFSYRFRYRLMIEREYLSGRMSIVPYVNVEPYYDSRYGIANRVRCVTGGTVAWTTHFAMEGNFTYQYDSRASVTNIYALSMILHVHF